MQKVKMSVSPRKRGREDLTPSKLEKTKVRNPDLKKRPSDAGFPKPDFTPSSGQAAEASPFLRSPRRGEAHRERVSPRKIQPKKEEQTYHLLNLGTAIAKVTDKIKIRGGSWGRKLGIAIAILFFIFALGYVLDEVPDDV